MRLSTVRTAIGRVYWLEWTCVFDFGNECVQLLRQKMCDTEVQRTGRVQLKCDGRRWHTGREVKRKLANGVGSQYSSHYLGTWCIQHYYRWYAHLNIVRVVKSRTMRWAGHVALMGEGKGVHRVLIGKPEGNRPLGRPRRRWEDNIKMDIQEVEGGGDWKELDQDWDMWQALVNTVMNFRVP